MAFTISSPNSVTEGSSFSVAFTTQAGTTKNLSLETTDSAYSINQVVDTWTNTSAVGSAIQGNWLKVLNGLLPSGTTNGLPFSSTYFSLQITILIDANTASRAQTYTPPLNYTLIEFNSLTSNITSDSIWYNVVGLTDGDQMLAYNYQTSTDGTPLNITWNSNGTISPDIPLIFNYSLVLFKSSNGKLTLLSKTYTPAIIGIVNVNSAVNLTAGALFTIQVSGVVVSRIHFVEILLNSKTWILPVNAIVSPTVINAYAPSDLTTSAGGITVSIKEWKMNSSNGDAAQNLPDVTWITIPKTATFTADLNTGNLIDTSIAPFSMLLPPFPKIGTLVSYIDYAKTFSTNNFTIDPNGNNMYGVADTYITSSDNEAGTLIYISVAQGWKFLSLLPLI